MPLQQTINELKHLLQEHPTLPVELSAEAEALRDRLLAGQLHLAVLGQFKRGKSTLINALLGAEILPSGVLPVTLVPVFLRFGDRPELEIRFANGHSPECYLINALGEFVNEANNPENIKQVKQVDLRYPADLLQNGIVLIDTPGVGSTRRHNTEMTLDFLPRCDAAIVVLSADPPITAAEIEFLQQLKPHIAHFLFVLNKIDYLDNGSAGEAVRFLYETLKHQAEINEPQILSVSARQGLQARLENDMGLWSRSGMGDLEQKLMAFAVNGKQATLEEAVRRKALNLALRADQLVAVEQQAMQMPLAELEQKIAIFKRYAQTAQQQRQEILDRLTGDAARLEGQIETDAEALREKARAELMKLAEAFELPTHDEKRIDDFHREVRAFFDRERSRFSTQYRDVLRAVLVERAESVRQIRENLRQEASSLLDVPHFSLLAEEIVVELAEPGWTIEHLPVRVKPEFSTLWLPKSLQARQYMRQREKLVNELTIRNVEKIRWWILRTIKESIASFRRSVTQELEETIQQIDRALQTGYQRQQYEKENLQEVLADLIVYRNRLNQICSNMERDISRYADGILTTTF